MLTDERISKKPHVSQTENTNVDGNKEATKAYLSPLKPSLSPSLASLASLFSPGSRIIDLLLFTPYGLIARKNVIKAQDLEDKANVIMSMEVKSINVFSSKRCVISCCLDNIHMDLVYFRFTKPRISAMFKVGETVTIGGAVQHSGCGWQIVHPEYVLKGKVPHLIPKQEGKYSSELSAKLIRKCISQALAKVDSLRLMENIDLKDVIAGMHYMSARKTYQEAREEMAFLEALASFYAKKMSEDSSEQSGFEMQPEGFCEQDLLCSLPFELTGAQRIAIDEIRSMQMSSLQMNAILQGDVGCGKTIVAFCAALFCIKSGFQCAIMAPTEILAKQHLQSALSLMVPCGVRVCLLTSKTPGKSKMIEAISLGKFDLVIGTHALLSQVVSFEKLGLVIIDEQHKFGVKQRNLLLRKNMTEQPDLSSAPLPDLLLMSATPIPRTMKLCISASIRVITIKQKPHSRLAVKTSVMNVSRAQEIIERIKDTGAKSYWICPLIEESENIDIKAAITRFEEISKSLKTGLMHSKMKEDKIQETMQDFISGKIQVLVSTTVVEVGVDVKDATLIVIEDAQRFGLAQLHQLRGRVGRSDLQSYCMLLYNQSQLSPVARKRLEVIKRCDDGFEIADEDLKLRGPGDILGLVQSGDFEYKFLGIGEDFDIFKKAAEYVKLGKVNSNEGKFLMEIFSKGGD